MIIIDCEQSSSDWLKAKLGIPSASEISAIITPAGEASKQYEDYADKVLAEEISGEPLKSFTSDDMENGKEKEPEAVLWYELQRKVTCVKTGFITDDERTLGASPDRLVGEDGLAEFKCSQWKAQMKYLLQPKPEAKHIPQIQAQLLVTGRKWCDLVCYGDRLPSCIIRVNRNEEYIAAMKVHLARFHRLLNSKRERMKELGYI